MGFVKGMDVSMAKALEAHGASYYLDGKQDDLFRILKKCGTDMIRLRIWPDPYDASGAPYGGGNNDLQTTVELAQRAKSSGMEVLRTFSTAISGQTPRSRSSQRRGNLSLEKSLRQRYICIPVRHSSI